METCLTVEKVFMVFTLTALRSSHSQIERKMAPLVLHRPFDLWPFQDSTLQPSPGLHQEQRVPGTSWFRLGRLLLHRADKSRAGEEVSSSLRPDLREVTSLTELR